MACRAVPLLLLLPAVIVSFSMKIISNSMNPGWFEPLCAQSVRGRQSGTRCVEATSLKSSCSRATSLDHGSHGIWHPVWQKIANGLWQQWIARRTHRSGHSFWKEEQRGIWWISGRNKRHKIIGIIHQTPLVQIHDLVQWLIKLSPTEMICIWMSCLHGKTRVYKHC